MTEFVPYPPLERHAVVGDRRTAALIAADGTITWWCIPDFDSAPVFDSLLDAKAGGHWRVGPEIISFGEQSYEGDTTVVRTVWRTSEWALELTDAMLWPAKDRAPANENRRAIVRRLRCARGQVPCTFRLKEESRRDTAAEQKLALWSSLANHSSGDSCNFTFILRQDEEAWFVLCCGDKPDDWSPVQAASALEETRQYWREWSSRINYVGPRANRVRRGAMTIHLMSFAPSGAVIAAPTTSVPERLGGDWNADYRFSWVRDASLAVRSLAGLGATDDAREFMDWLSVLRSSNEMPLQVLYRIDGRTDPIPHEQCELPGYRESAPVRFGNHAFQQTQLGALGYFADCALVYLEHNGIWKSEYGGILRRAVEYTVAHWDEPDNGIWELSEKRHYVSSKVMAWVTIDRALRVFERIGVAPPAEWGSTMDIIHKEVMDRGWSEQLQSFCQSYDLPEALDASALLIPLMGFLPVQHPRVRTTVARIACDLTRDGMVYRFDPQWIFPRDRVPPLGEYEAAFLPCCFWLAAAYAMAGQVAECDAIMDRVESVAGGPGLFAEGLDPRTRSFMGNGPLLFSHAEYIRAVLESTKARSVGAAVTVAEQRSQN